MNYLQLREEVLGMMGQTIAIVDPFPGLAASADDKLALINKLCLRAANNARKFAEKANPNWVLNEVSADVTVVAGEKVSLAGHTDRDTEEEFDFHVLDTVTHEGVPIFLNSRKMRHKMRHNRKKDCRKIYGLTSRNQFYLTPSLDEDVDLVFYGTRWMSDYNLDPTTFYIMTVTGTLSPDATGVFTRKEDTINGKVYYTYGNIHLINETGAIFGPEDANDCGAIVWDGELWKIDWFEGGTASSVAKTWFSNAAGATPDAGSPVWSNGSGTTGTPTVTASTIADTPDGSLVTDWMFEHGFDYLQWATICELNYLLKVYLPRQEGGLAPPTNERDRALDFLIRWDTDMRDSQTNATAR